MCLHDCKSVFGHFGCDSPKALVDLVMDKMSKLEPDLDVLLVSGDFIAHGFSVNEGSPDHYAELKGVIKYVFVDLLSSKFPNTIILPSIGNNDIKYHYKAPAQDEEAKDYYTFFADVLFNQVSGNKRIKTDLIKQSFLFKGYFRYDYDWPTYSDGFYLSFLSFNSLYYSVNAPALAGDTIDPDQEFKREYDIMQQQLDWLETQLSTAEDDRKFVIFFHIYPGEYQVHRETYFWDDESTLRFTQIVEKYPDNIAVILGAHTHFGDIRINKHTTESLGSSTFLKSTKNRQANIAKMALLITPSITPIFMNNPGFTTFRIENNLVKDVKMTYFELNRFPESAEKATFNTLDFKEELGIEIFSPNAVEQFLDSIQDSYIYFYRYLAHKIGYRGILELFGIALYWQLGSISLTSRKNFY
jgi:hypothetical protein